MGCGTDVYYNTEGCAYGVVLRNQMAATEPPFDFGSQRLPAPVSGGQARSDIPWVIDTVVPFGFLTTSI